MEFLANHIGLILAIIGGLGTAGLIAMIVFLGIPLAAIIPAVVNAFKAVLDFLKTPLGQVIGIGALCALCLFIGDLHGTRTESAKCRAADLAAELAATKRDAAIDKATADRAKRDAVDLQATNDALNSQVKDYEAALLKAPVDRCGLNSDDLARLRAIDR